MDTHVSSLVKTIRLGIVIILLGSTVGCMKELASISPYVTRMTLAAVIATQVGGVTFTPLYEQNDIKISDKYRLNSSINHFKYFRSQAKSLPFQSMAEIS